MSCSSGMLNGCVPAAATSRPCSRAPSAAAARSSRSEPSASCATALSVARLAIVAATAFVAPLVRGFVPPLRLTNGAREVVLGILIGPSVLGWAKADGPVQIMSLIGLSFLLLVAGLEVDYERF